MTRTLTAMTVTPGITYSTRAGNSYRADWSGIVHVLSTDVTEMSSITPKNQAGTTTGASPATASASDVGVTHHRGSPTSLTLE